MKTDKLKEWIDLFKESGMTYMSIKDGEEEVVFSTQEGVIAPKISKTSSHGGHAVVPEDAPEDEAEAIAAEKVGNEIVSSMIGTFYRAPSPEDPPFVKPGDEIEAGQVLCIIEAMKMMNEIKAKEAGKVLEVYVANGEKVEYGQPLFLIG